MDRSLFKTYNVPPSAGNLIESLRGIGYTMSTALADIIDNSLAANASRVDLHFICEGERQAVAVLDNGHGMSDDELLDAMRLGYLSPLTTRADYDLGRFGLGLKTASFSQCRCLTVASKRENGQTATLRWDLDRLSECSNSEWILLEEPGPEAERILFLLDSVPHGTLVIWEKLDRILTSGMSFQDFLNLIDRAERHLALTFHRFLQQPHATLVLTINGEPVKAHDPFMQNHPATWNSSVISWTLANSPVIMQGHVLPHKDRLTEREYEEASGTDGWTAHQGFYVYRNMRLIVAGSWLGLGSSGRAWTKEEAHRLARIRLDIPNTADAEWKLDIRKSTASPPAAIRKVLVHLAETVRERARRVFACRGEYTRTSGETENTTPIWVVKSTADKVEYRIYREHPAVAPLLSDVSGKAVQAMLALIEKNVPVQRIWLDAAEGRDAPKMTADSESEEEVKSILSVVYENYKQRMNMSADEAKNILKKTEPFCMYKTLIDEL